MTLLILLGVLALDAHAVNGADDSPVLAPGAPVQRPLYNVPLSPGVATTPQKVYQLPIDTPPPPAPATTANEEPTANSPSSSNDNPLSSLMPMLQGLGAGGAGAGSDRAAGSGDSGGGLPPASTGSSSALDLGGAAGTKNGRAMNTVNGCASGAGKFQLIYGKPPAACSPGRDGSLKMSETLSTFMDRNLNRCVSEAAPGTNASGGKLYHAGVIGDARHQKTGSLHNEGLAIDVNAIEVGNKKYDYAAKDAETKAFFAKFRACWGKAAQTERLGCLQNGKGGTSPGTVGDEDSDHTGHLHLSVPPCPAEARAKGLYLARLIDLALPRAAADVPGDTKRHVLPLEGRGQAELVIRDQRGEPVDADQRFAVHVRCGAERAARTLIDDEGGCDFVAFTKVEGELELRYLRSELSDGELICRKLVIKRMRPGCPVSK